MKEFERFEWFEWFEWFGPSPTEPFNSGEDRAAAGGPRGDDRQRARVDLAALRRPGARVSDAADAERLRELRGQRIRLRQPSVRESGDKPLNS